MSEVAEKSFIIPVVCEKSVPPHTALLVVGFQDDSVALSTLGGGGGVHIRFINRPVDRLVAGLLMIAVKIAVPIPFLHLVP